MQQQQSADYDLLAVFPDETKAEAAATKLHKEGFSDEEVHQLPAGASGNGQFREHGPNTARREVFLQTQRSKPNPAMIVLLAVVFGLVLGLLTFAGTFALPPLHVPLIIVLGALIGIILGAITGVFQGRRVRGAIGQNTQQKVSAPNPSSGARTVIALSFADPDNISRKSRARAILLNNQGKIDRSVGQRE